MDLGFDTASCQTPNYDPLHVTGATDRNGRLVDDHQLGARFDEVSNLGGGGVYIAEVGVTVVLGRRANRQNHHAHATELRDSGAESGVRSAGGHDLGQAALVDGRLAR